MNLFMLAVYYLLQCPRDYLIPFFFNRQHGDMILIKFYHTLTISLYPLLQERDIPVLIFSAGLADIIEEVS